MKRLRINLATSPLRNRRLYFLLLGVLAACCAAAALSSGVLFIKHRMQNARVRATVQKLRDDRLAAETETKRTKQLNKEAARREKIQVDFANETIFLKSFSWTGLLAHLEESLPASSHIVTLAPSSLGQARVEVRLRAVFPDVDDLLAFVNRLNADLFRNIRLLSEERSDDGRILSEVLLVYEQTR